MRQQLALVISVVVGGIALVGFISFAAIQASRDRAEQLAPKERCVAQVGDGREIELIGIGFHPDRGHRWWHPSGPNIGPAPFRLRTQMQIPGQQELLRSFALKFEGFAREADFKVRFQPPVSVGDDSDRVGATILFEATAGPFDEKTTLVEVHVKDGAFHPMRRLTIQGRKSDGSLKDLEREVDELFQPASVEMIGGNAWLTLNSAEDLDRWAELEIRAISKSERDLVTLRMPPRPVDPDAPYSPIPPGSIRVLGTTDEISHFEYRLRPMAYIVSFKNVALHRRTQQPVEISIETVTTRKSERLSPAGQ